MYKTKSRTRNTMPQRPIAGGGRSRGKRPHLETVDVKRGGADRGEEVLTVGVVVNEVRTSRFDSFYRNRTSEAKMGEVGENA